MNAYEPTKAVRAGAKNAPMPEWSVLPGQLGAACDNLDLSQSMSPQIQGVLFDAFRAHHVLVIRNQHLENEHLHHFAQMFGEVEQHNIVKADGQRMEAVHVITNLDASGKPSARPFINSNYHWHSDKSYLKKPSLMTMLYSVELPPEGGGDTQFADMTRAYAALSPQTKAEIAGLRVVQSLAHMRSSLGNPAPTPEEARSAPPVEQPLVRTHPETGEKSLYLGMYCSHVVGMEEEKGRDLLRHLLDHATQPQFLLTHRWALGDVVLWDNRCLMHRAIANYEMNKHRRILKRVCVKGTDVPH